MVSFTPWPEATARFYYEQQYWCGEPLTRIISQHENSSQPALICAGRTYSYEELNQLSSALAAGLLQRGICAGDTALVQLPNSAEFYIVFFACLKAGVVPVSALFTHSSSEMKAYAEQIKPALLIGSVSHALFQNDDFLNSLSSDITSLKGVFLDAENSLADNLDALIAAGSNTSHSELQPSAADEVAFFQLSGGTTGTPKLIPRTHNDYLYSIVRSNELCGIGQHTRFLCALPCAHNYPMSSPGALGVLDAGGCVVITSSPEAQQCLQLIEQYRITVVALVPPAAALWLQAMETTDYDLSSLKLMQLGGARLSESLARKIIRTFPGRLQQVFGMAEGLVCYTGLDDSEDRICLTQGRPMCPDDEVVIRDEDGFPVADGEEGQLSVRGPYTIRGYFNAPEHNRSSFDREGFYYSGDLVRRDKDGYLQVTGRVKDQINRGGEKIAAEEVENLLLQFPGIMHSALVSMPDILLGEKSCAFIVPAITESRIRPVELRRYLRQRGLADYKIPDHFEFIGELPLTHVGKPDKKYLRQLISQKRHQKKEETA